MNSSRKPDPLTTKSYWDATYETREALAPVDPHGAHARVTQEILCIKKRIGLDEKRVLEIGGGGSAWLAFLAKAHPSSEFTCLDYSEVGVESLRHYAHENELNNLKFKNSDMFQPPLEYERYDIVFSHGVVEHFPDLSGVLIAHARYLSDDGILLSIIPNMAGILGLLTKIFNRTVYNIHVPHDLKAFRQGHSDAELEIIESGYLCSSNFGVLSSCFKRKEGWKWATYKFLSRVSKAVWIFENSVASLPTSRTFSPYIYVAAKHRPIVSK